MRFLPVILLIACACIVAACASTGSTGSQNKSGVITKQEIEESGLVFGDAYDVVRQLRPSWLIKRGVSTVGPRQGNDADLMDFIAVYVDRVFMGDTETLRGVSSLSVEEIEHLNTARAQRLGSRSHIHGAIVVKTRAQ